MTLGQILISARSAAGLSVEELAKRTNLRPALIKEFEDNFFLHAGGDTYVRGHLRSIARVLNVDSEIFLKQFEAEHAQVTRTIHDQLVESSVAQAVATKSRITYKQIVALSIIGIVMVLGISSVVNATKKGAVIPTVTATPKVSATPTVSPSETPTGAIRDYSSGSGVSVKLSATNGSSWLFVTDSAGVTLYSGRASQGETFTFSSTEIVNLRIGNAGAVKLTVNGKELPSLGAIGEVVNVSYGVNS